MKLYRVISLSLLATSLAASLLAVIPTTGASAQAPLAVNMAPPSIPDSAQPPCPGDGYIWTPGSWTYGANGYVWVSGAWVMPPYSGGLWTPGYWGTNGGFYRWFPGYWGMSVGYYGGINYGYGYSGYGFYGGYWNGARFWYNRSYGSFGRGFGGNTYSRGYLGASMHSGGASFGRAGNVGNAGATEYRSSLATGVENRSSSRGAANSFNSVPSTGGSYAANRSTVGSAPVRSYGGSPSNGASRGTGGSAIGTSSAGRSGGAGAGGMSHGGGHR